MPLLLSVTIATFDMFSSLPRRDSPLPKMRFFSYIQGRPGPVFCIPVPHVLYYFTDMSC